MSTIIIAAMSHEQGPTNRMRQAVVAQGLAGRYFSNEEFARDNAPTESDTCRSTSRCRGARTKGREFGRKRAAIEACHDDRECHGLEVTGMHCVTNAGTALRSYAEWHTWLLRACAYLFLAEVRSDQTNGTALCLGHSSFGARPTYSS